MYIILEIQTDAGGNVATLVHRANEAMQAESVYHQVLAAAAISALPVHAAVLLANNGRTIESKAYYHETEQGVN